MPCLAEKPNNGIQDDISKGKKWINDVEFH